MSKRTEEKALIVCKKHWVTVFLPCILVGFLLIIACLCMTINTIIGIIGFLIAGYCAIYYYIGYKMDYLALNGKNLVGKQGFINSKTISIPLSRIQTIQIENGLLGKILGYHTIKIANAGTGMVEIVFKYMAHAREFAAAVQESIED